jgi:hypothetical protein
MALFYVGYLLAVTSTIAFIVAILTPKWIYPNNFAVNSTYPASPLESNFRGIFYVDQGRTDGICRGWILIYTASVASCRPGMYSENDLTSFPVNKIILSYSKYF